MAMNLQEAVRMKKKAISTGESPAQSCSAKRKFRILACGSSFESLLDVASNLIQQRSALLDQPLKRPNAFRERIERYTRDSPILLP